MAATVCFHLRSPTANAPPLSMVLDHANTLWTIGDGIRRFANGRWTTVETGPDWEKDALYSTLVDQDGREWAAAPTGVWRLNSARDRFEKVSGVDGGLAITPKGDVWQLGGRGGLSTRLSEAPRNQHRPARAAAIASRAAGQFASDGTLWALGCPDTACLVHDPARHGAQLHAGRNADERVASAEGVAGQDALSIIEDREGSIWIHAPNGLNQFRPKRFLVPNIVDKQ